MSRQTPAKKFWGLSHLEWAAVPFWLFATRPVWDWVPPEWVVAASLSFVAYLFVRRR